LNVASLVQALIPLKDQKGLPFDHDRFNEVRRELTQRFGGVTAYSRAPAEGDWRSGKGVERDDVIVIEVVVEELDAGWGKSYRQQLEQRFQQDEILVRAIDCRVL
jgi:hypothetical protein